MLIERDWKLPIPRKISFTMLVCLNFLFYIYFKDQRAVHSKRHLMEIFSKYLPYIIYFIYLFEKELVLLDTGAMKAVKNQKMVLVGEES